MSRYPGPSLADYAACASLDEALALLHRQIAIERAMWAPGELPMFDAYVRGVEAAEAIWRDEMASARDRVLTRLRAGEAGTDGAAGLIADAIESGDYTPLAI